jgi:Leucine-rich repeat (LRR) protein
LAPASSLYLFNNDIGGQLPSELGLLTALAELDLSENSFTGALPIELDGMTSIERLFIRQTGGGLSGSLPAFNKFPNLLELSLDDNNLTGSISPEFLAGIQNKSQYIYVSLANNQVGGTLPKELDVFDALDILLEGNNISGIPSELCDKSNWMFGMVGALGNSCDAILCPPGTFNTYGKLSTSGYSICGNCSSAKYYGTVRCDSFAFNVERFILDNLFHATGGSQWKRNTNWTAVGIPICFREGIICLGGDTDSGVLEIELSDNGLTSDVPADIFDLPQLKLLALSDNQIDLSWERASTAKNLVTLKLSNTNLRSLTGIGQTSATLTELHIAGNQLTGTIPSEVYELTNLKQLFMDNNLFTGSIASMIGEIVNLEQFHSASNMLTGNIPTELGALTSLEQLDLKLNYLSGNLPMSFDNLTGLTTLSLKGQKGKTKLSGPIISFSSTAALSFLDLSENDFSGTIPDDFLAKVPQSASISVDLRQNRIGGTLPTSLASRFTQLSIDLADNEIIRLFDDTCDSNDWMSGKVADYSCDAILCSPGFAAKDGKQVSSTTPCMQCPGSLLDAPFFGSTECKSHIFGNSTERNILIKLYEILNGTSWEAQTYWNSDMNHCTWYGIVCNSDGVSEFNMEANGLEAGPEASSWIFSLPHLEKLDLKGKSAPGELVSRMQTNFLRSVCRQQYSIGFD